MQTYNVAGPTDVGSTAELRRKITDLADAYHVAVLLAEKGHRALSDGIVIVGLEDLHGGVLGDLRLHDFLDFVTLVGLDGIEVRHIEPQSGGRDEVTLLVDVRPEPLPERGMKEVRRGMVALDGATAIGVDLGLDNRARLERSRIALDHLANVHPPVTVFARIFDTKHRIVDS